MMTSNKIYWIPKTVTRDKKGTNILIAKKIEENRRGKARDLKKVEISKEHFIQKWTQ